MFVATCNWSRTNLVGWWLISREAGQEYFGNKPGAWFTAMAARTMHFRSVFNVSIRQAGYVQHIGFVWQRANRFVDVFSFDDPIRELLPPSAPPHVPHGFKVQHVTILNEVVLPQLVRSNRGAQRICWSLLHTAPASAALQTFVGLLFKIFYMQGDIVTFSWWKRPLDLFDFFGDR